MKNVKVSAIGILDMLKFRDLGKARAEEIEKASDSALPRTYKVNEVASSLHPTSQPLVISEIMKESKDTKSFILKREDGKSLAFFKAGSYLNVSLKIGSSRASRVYSISSSPGDALKGFYRITVKRKVGGFLSEYLLDSAAIGDKINASEPFGRLTYSGIRDERTVIALAGGTGITPFISMALAIAEGSEDFRLTLLYGVRREEDILFKDTLASICEKTDKVKVVCVLSEEEKEGFEHGFITAELVGKYAPPSGKYSVFIAGPSAMLDFFSAEYPKLGKEAKFLRVERTAEEARDRTRETYKLTVLRRGEKKVIEAKSDETVLQSLERAGFTPKAMCRVGGCGYCRSVLISGAYSATKYEKLRLADKQYHIFHPCCSYPDSDMEIEIM